jgi:hypothetical protein
LQKFKMKGEVFTARCATAKVKLVIGRPERRAESFCHDAHRVGLQQLKSSQSFPPQHR